VATRESPRPGRLGTTVGRVIHHRPLTLPSPPMGEREEKTLVKPLSSFWSLSPTGERAG